MKSLLSRFSFSAAKFNGQVLLAMVAIWLVIVVCAISSILSRPFTEKERRFWIAVVVLIPIFGVMAYLPFAFRQEELPPFLMMRQKRERKGRRRSSSRERLPAATHSQSKP